MQPIAHIQALGDALFELLALSEPLHVCQGSREEQLVELEPRVLHTLVPQHKELYASELLGSPLGELRSMREDLDCRLA